MRLQLAKHKLKSVIFLSLATLFGYCGQSYAEMVQVNEDGPIHEAFVSQVSGNLTLEAVPVKPPADIAEKTPKQLDMQAEWIPGYWSWDSQDKDFCWVSGAWRRPPPGHQWIPGFWKTEGEGWVWVPGFWSRVPLQNVEYIGIIPPDALDQSTAPPPSDNYFWAPGYWLYQANSQEYKWVKGHWEEFDPNWIFIPSHYMWRPGGYIFIPAYWDWPLENRGTAYASVYIGPNFRYRVNYEPNVILRAGNIIQTLFKYYPDYLTLFHHHWRFNAEYWKGFCCTPAWWSWDTWWCFTWQDHWSLWWWYTHPGYPQPSWITKELSEIIPPPLPELVESFKFVRPPAIVTPKGVVSRAILVDAIRRTIGDFEPILPFEKDLRTKVYKIANYDTELPPAILSPIGRRVPINPNSLRPNVRKPVIASDLVVNQASLNETLAPHMPYKPKIPLHGRAPIWKTQQETQDVPVYTPPIRRPSWTPRPFSQNTKGEPGSTNPYRSPIAGFNQDQPDTPQKWKLMEPVKDTKVFRPPVHSQSTQIKKSLQPKKGHIKESESD